MEAELQTWTLRKVLDWTTSFFQRKQIDPPRVNAELILAHVLNVQRIRLYTDLHRLMSDAELARVRDLVKRAGEHEPIQYLTGKSHFFTLEFDVTRDVLIPRPDTETLVELALAELKVIAPTDPKILDLCTGSGCVAAAIAANNKACRVIGVDVSLKAIDVARRNITSLKLDSRVTLLCGDLFEPIKSHPDTGLFDVIVANPPYIASSKIANLDASVRDFEPHLALDGGDDGLDIHRRILAAAPDFLKPGGRVFLEIAFDQEEAAMWLIKQQSWLADFASHRDYGKNPRVISARRPASPLVG